MKSRLSEGFKKGIPEGSLQAHLTLLATQCAPVDKPLIEGARVTGDHTAGLAVMFKQMGVIQSIEDAMPTLGFATIKIRDHNEFIVDPEQAEFFQVPTGPQHIKTRNN